MVDTTVVEPGAMSVSAQSRRAARSWATWFMLVVCASAAIGLGLLRSGPGPAVLGWLALVAVVAAIVYQPRWGVFLTIFLGLVGDGLLMPWYPFLKNLSSGESLLYAGDALIFSPNEVCLVLTTVSWLGRGLVRRKLDLFTGPLFWPALLFMGMIAFGLVYGIGRGGNVNVALWEARASFDLPLLLVLVSNLVRARGQLNSLLWAIVLGVFVKGIAGDLFFLVELQGSLGGREAIAEHGASIHLNALFVFAVSAWLYRASPAKRIALPLMSLVAVLTYMMNQRRASYIALVLALLFVAVELYRVNRAVFWRLIPALALIAVAYVAAFWNSTSPLGQPVRAIRSVIAPAQGGRDDLSNVYRLIENINTNYTIHRVPLTGVGFGQKFFVIVPLPDISFFVWYEYITHNSVMWIWMKAGALGFFALLLLIGMGLSSGARATRRMPVGDLSAITLTATLYILMHFVFAYVDMSWDNPGMLMVGVMLGVINVSEHVVDQPAPMPRARWPWQPAPRPAPSLAPVE